MEDDIYYYELGDRPVDLARYHEATTRVVSDEHHRQQAPPTAYDVHRAHTAVNQTRSPGVQTKQHQFSKTVGDAPKPRHRFLHLF